MSVLKLPLFVHQQWVGKLVLSIASCPSIIERILLISVQKEWGYGNFNQQHNVSPSHLHALLGAGLSVDFEAHQLEAITAFLWGRWGILWRWYACVLTTYNVVSKCQTFKKHCSMQCASYTLISFVTLHLYM
jgi:hypothetical protein